MRFFFTLLLLVFSLFYNPKLLVRAQYIINVDNHQHHSHNSRWNTLNACFFVVLLIVVSYLVYRYFDRYYQQGWWAHETPNQAQVGLDPSTLETFPVFLYSEVSGLGDDKGPLECAVCLGTFEKDEKVRQLPKCKHMFHLECVNGWLASHTTCPLCRAELAHRLDDSAKTRLDCADGSMNGSSAQAVTATVDDVV